MLNPLPFLTNPGVFGRQRTENKKTNDGNNGDGDGLVGYFKHFVLRGLF